MLFKYIFSLRSIKTIFNFQFRDNEMANLLSINIYNKFFFLFPFHTSYFLSFLSLCFLSLIFVLPLLFFLLLIFLLLVFSLLLFYRCFVLFLNILINMSFQIFFFLNLYICLFVTLINDFIDF